MRTYDRGRGSGYSGGPGRDRELTPEERAAIERRDAAFEAAARQALTECIAQGKAPERELGRAQLFWARIRAPELLQQAETSAQESGQAAENQAHSERQQHQAHNADRAALLMANLRAAAAYAIPSVEGEAREARMAGQLRPDGTHAILTDVQHRVTDALMGCAKDDGARSAIRVLCERIGRGETVEALGPNLEAVAARLGEALADKARGAAGEMFAAIPDVAELAALIESAGHAALAKATGRRSARPPMDAAPPTSAAGADGGGQPNEPGAVSSHADGNAPPADWTSRIVASLPSEAVVADDPGHRYHVLSDNTVVAASEPRTVKPEVAAKVLPAAKPKTPAEELAPYGVTVDEFTDYCKHHTSRGWDGSQAAGLVDQFLVARAVEKIPEDVRRRVKHALFHQGDQTLVMEEIGGAAVIGTRQQNAERRADEAAQMERETLGNMTGGIFGAVGGGVAQWLHPDDRAKIHAASGIGALVDNMIFAHGMKGEGSRLEPPTERAIFQHGSPTHEVVEAHPTVGETHAPVLGEQRATEKAEPSKGATDERELASRRQSLVDVLHQRELGNDPAGKRFKPGEAKLGRDIEQRQGVRLRRDPSGAGDWIDANGKCYDAVGPVPSEHFKTASFINSIREHLPPMAQGIDHVVVDLRGLSPAQVADVDNFISSLSGSDSAKLIIFR